MTRIYFLFIAEDGEHDIGVSKSANWCSNSVNSLPPVVDTILFEVVFSFSLQAKGPYTLLSLNQTLVHQFIKLFCKYYYNYV